MSHRLVVQMDHLSTERKSHLIQLIVKYSDIFALIEST